MGLSALHLEYQAGWQSYLLHPLYLLLGSSLLGWLVEPAADLDRPLARARHARRN